MTDQSEPTKTRATKAETRLRVAKVTDWLATGLSRAQILQTVAEKTTWNLKPRQVDSYIHKATEAFKTAGKYDPTTEFQKAKRRMEMIIAACLRVQDYARAIAASKELHTLMALYEPPARQTLKIEGLDLFHLLAEKIGDPGKLRELIAAMLAELESDAS